VIPVVSSYQHISSNISFSHTCAISDKGGDIFPLGVVGVAKSDLQK